MIKLSNFSCAFYVLLSVPLVCTIAPAILPWGLVVLHRKRPTVTMFLDTFKICRVFLVSMVIVVALEGAGGKGGRTGVNDGPQTTTNKGIKVEHSLEPHS